MKKKYFSIAKFIIAKQKRCFFLTCVITLLQNSILLSIPMFYQQLIDKILPEKNTDLFFKIILLVCILYVINSGFSILKDYLLARFAENIAFDLRQKLNDSIPFLQYQFFDNNNTANLIAKYSKDIDAIKENYGYMLIKVLGNIISLISASVMLMLLDYKIMLITICIIVLYIATNKILGLKVKTAAQKMLQCNENSTDVFSENCNNILTTKIYNSYNLISSKFKKIYTKQYESQISLELLYSCNLNLSCLYIYFLAIIIWFIGGLGIISGNMSFGKVLAMVNYQTMLLSPLNFVCEFNNSYQSTVSALERIESILTYPKETHKTGRKCNNIDNIVFKEVVFGYSNEKILNGDNFSFEKGNVYGVLGCSGSGKSTIGKLILRLYQPEAGIITVNGLNIQEFDVLELRKHIILIMQESQFYKDTIIDNIILSNSEYDWENILMLAKELEMDKEIEKMPNQWNTLLNSGASNISGGQKKRLDIIRAISHKADVIIFDESTAYLDIEKRQALFRIVDRMKRNKIVIFITHNVEETANYDVIYAFDKGVVKEIKKNNILDVYKKD